MKHLTANICLTIAVLLGSAGVSWGADFDKGLAAAKRGDFGTALREWKPLAEQGNARARYNLGWMYANGRGVPQDHKAAAKWHKLAAEQGIAHAQNSLGNKDAVDYLGLFSGACLRNMHAPKNIKTYAELNEWKPIPEKLRDGFAPQKGTLIGNWVAKLDGKIGLLAVTKARSSSGPVWTCALSGKMAKPAELLAELNLRFSTKKHSEFVEGFQRYRFYSITVDGNRYTVMFLNGEHPKIRDAFTISVSTKKF